MATTAAQPAQRAAVIDDESPVWAWFQARQKPILIVVGIVLLGALVAWYLAESGRRKEVQASEALDRARAAMESGNYPQASTDFQRVTQSYAGTDAAREAVLALNQVRMLSGQSQLAVDELRKFLESDPPGIFKSAAHSHLAMALENTGKPADALAEYLQAAETATEDYRKIDALLNAARVQRSLGKEKEAAEILQGIVTKYSEETAGVAEAKVRLAEVTGGPA